MIEQTTIESAKRWCHVGRDWIGKGAMNLGMNYLDKAIPVFQEIGARAWLTFAQHHKLQGYQLKKQDDMVETMFEDVMAGYVHLHDTYGQTLLLVHLAECLARQGRQERALAQLNLALGIAERAGMRELASYALVQQASLYVRRRNYLRAVHLLRQAEAHYDAALMERETIGVRQQLAEALIAMGETGEAIALLEDVQTRLWSREEYRDVLRPLKLLSNLYTETGVSEDKERVTQMLHWTGQHLIRDDAPPAHAFPPQPPIGPADPDSAHSESASA